jgi:hypothetical protein
MEAAVEAVIISGPRRGEIIRMPDEARAEVSDQDMQALNTALDGLVVALERVSTEVHATIEALRERVGES